MPGSVLGKRTRSAAALDTPSKPRAKRLARADIFDEDQENADVHRESRQSHGHAGDSEDELAQPSSVRSPLSPASKNPRLAKRAPVPGKTHPLTPQTPRHRDALAKEGSCTPRHRVVVTAPALTPLTPRTPRTPLTPGSSITTVYNQARQLFTRSSESGQLIGREMERATIQTAVEDAARNMRGGCLYVSGPPGTGKSAMVNEVTNAFEATPNFRKAYINCMSMSLSKDILAAVLNGTCSEDSICEGEEIATLHRRFVPNRKSKTIYVIILDEIDHILGLDLEMLYTLFEWSLHPSSRLLLLGIANALDLTDRFLPRLKARNLKPQLLPFLPYSATQIRSIITTRLKGLLPRDTSTPNQTPFLHPAAIELCSRKVASQTGDLRKAFDICRRAIDVIEADTKAKHWEKLMLGDAPCSPSKQPLQEKINLGSTTAALSMSKELTRSLATLTAENAPRATIAHVNSITASAFSNGASSRLKGLNLQQKAALCSLLALEKKKRHSDKLALDLCTTPSKSTSDSLAPTIKELYTTYCLLCTQDSLLHPLTGTEFRDVLGGLEGVGLVATVDGRKGSFGPASRSGSGLGASPPFRAVPLSGTRARGRKPGGLFGTTAATPDARRVASLVGEKEMATVLEGPGSVILRGMLGGDLLN